VRRADGPGERVIEACNSKSSIRPGLFRFLAIFVFVSFCHFLMTPVWLLFFSCSLWFVLFGGVFFLLYPHFLPRVFSILPEFACVLCFIWIFGFFVPRFRFPFWQICLSIHFLLRSLRTNPICRFLLNSATSTFPFSRILEFSSCVDRVGGGFLFFLNEKKYGGCCLFFPLRY